jgi:predicted permease
VLQAHRFAFFIGRLYDKMHSRLSRKEECMANLQISAEVMLPLFLMMALGYVLRRFFSLDEHWVRVTNTVIFRLLLPLLLFRNMYESDIAGILDPGTVGVALLCICGVTVTFLLLYLIVPRVEPEDSRRGVLIQGIFRGNTAIFGIPVATQLFGEGKIALTVLLVSCVVPLLNVLSVIALERFRSGKTDVRKMLIEIVKNPLVIAIMLGVVANLLHIGLPSFIKNTAWSLSNCATPVSFLTLGASFTFASAAKNRKALTGAVLARLFVVPFIWIGLAGLLGYRNQQIAGVMLIFAPSTAVSSFPMACAMGGDAQLSSEIVVFTSAFCMLSMFLWIFGLKSLGWM